MPITQTELRSDIDYAVDLERRLRDHLSDLDSGSYCEGASPEFELFAKAARTCRELHECLMVCDRRH